MAEKQEGGRKSFFLRITTRGKEDTLLYICGRAKRLLCIYTRMEGTDS